MHSESGTTRIQKRLLQEEMLNNFGVLIPAPLLSGITVHALRSVLRIFQEASERFLQDQQHQEEKHTEHVTERIIAHEIFTPGLPMHPTTGQVEVELQVPRPRCSTCGRVAGMPSEPCRECPDASGSRTPSPAPNPGDHFRDQPTTKHVPGQHMVIGLNTPAGSKVCYCAIGRDHGPTSGLGGSTHV